ELGLERGRSKSGALHGGHPTLNHYFRHFFGTNDSRYRYCPVKNSIIRYVIPHAKPFIRADMIT
ncbi:MAG: hypothetical protein ACLSB9_21225, partial [Hydrogeniiclostridium mannosilyticum]